MLSYDLPLNEVVFDFNDRLKSVSSGYASFDYEISGYREGDLVKLGILVNSEPVDALAMIIHKDFAQKTGRQVCEKLKDLIPRHNFMIPVQAAIGGKIVARESIKGFKKDVLTKIHGGGATDRKRKLLENENFFCDNIDIKSTPEGLNKKFEVHLFGRKSNKKRAHEIKLKKIKIFSNIFSYLYEVIKSSEIENTKYLVISITPYTLLICIFLKLFGKTPIVYLRSDGYGEYKAIFGNFGKIIYHFMFTFIVGHLKNLNFYMLEELE